MDKKEYIERDSIYRRVKERTNPYGKPTLNYESGVKVLNMIEREPAADVVSRGVFEQVKWERDMAMQQLEEHGIPFGGEADDVVNVVRCKDCKYFKHFKGCGNWCHRRIRTDIEFHTKTNDFCSWGKRKDKDDGR